ncbi:hypothetical protein [Pedobacter jeongneungensis]|uniref:hypothetical protein n=1 Tax=Pedobacter jeongneungensis TaxID=947309 RepID=UPI00046881F6|nr:hypothetical protein [Pedobacter jeongneungensis]
MKNRLMVIALLAMLGVLGNCRRASLEEFIRGVYVSHSHGEFAVASDTLVIGEAKGNVYPIVRNTAYQVLLDGRLGKREWDSEHWTGIWDEGRQVMQEQKKGRLIRFEVDSARLVIGRRVYQKVDR